MMNFRVSIPSVKCLGCGRSNYLPHRSPLGIFQHPESRPTDVWPITFVCTSCGKVSAHYSPPDDHGGPAGSLPDLWQVECQCDHENCGKHHDIYTTYNSGFPKEAVRQRLVQLSVRIGCSGHDFLLTEETMREMKRSVVD